MWSKIEIIGHLGKDPESRFLDNGTQVTSFSVATSEKWTKDGEKHEKTTWFRVSAWGKLADITNNFLKKGSLVFVSGQLTSDKDGNPRVWNTTDGTARASFELKANEVKFLSSKAEAKAETEEDADVPF